MAMKAMIKILVFFVENLTKCYSLQEVTEGNEKKTLQQWFKENFQESIFNSDSNAY